MRRIAIIVGTKGRGSNMRALAEKSAAGGCFRVGAVVCSNDAAPSVQVARELGLTVRITANDAESLNKATEDCDLICLAGYMRLFPAQILQRRPNRVLNIHPALLPKFGGKGMYGMHVHEAVIAAGETESGCTVHYVSEHYDEGAIVHQLRCPVYATDSADDLAARVLKLEHQAYFEAVCKVLQC